MYNDSRAWTQCFQATLVAEVAVVVAPVVAPVSPVAPCAGQGGFMTTDLKQFCGLPSTTIKIMVDPIPMMKTLR